MKKHKRAGFLILASIMLALAILLHFGGAGVAQTVPFNYNNFLFFGSPCSSIKPQTPFPNFAECFDVTTGKAYYWNTTSQAFLQAYPTPTATPT